MSIATSGCLRRVGHAACGSYCSSRMSPPGCAEVVWLCRRRQHHVKLFRAQQSIPHVRRDLFLVGTSSAHACLSLVVCLHLRSSRLPLGPPRPRLPWVLTPVPRAAVGWVQLGAARVLARFVLCMVGYATLKGSCPAECLVRSVTSDPLRGGGSTTLWD